MNEITTAATNPQPSRVTESSVYIFNLSEDIWPFILAMSDVRARDNEIMENASLADRDLFSHADEDNVLFISPKQVTKEFFDYYIGLFGNKNFRVVSPKRHSGEICKDIEEDEKIIQEIINVANGSKKINLISYSTTQQFLHLAKVLRDRGITVSTPEAPEEEDAWTVNFFGSKSGIRQLSATSGAVEPDFRMAEGVICDNPTDAAKIAAKKYLKSHGVVIKTNKGHAGMGVLIFRPGDLPETYAECDGAIYKQLRKDAYWKQFPIIIEDFIQINPTIGGGFPNVEFKIWKTGKIEFLYYCSMRVRNGGVFNGVEIHNDVLSDQASAQLVDTGFYIGERYAANGYRGYFDVDFISGKNGKLYVTESNVRRTGGTHVYIIAEKLFGKDFMYQTFTLSNNIYDLPSKKQTSFPELITQLTPVMYDKKTKEGVIIVSENILHHGLMAYVIFGKNRKRAYEIEAQMEILLASL